MAKGILLLSGGLDSVLAGKILLEQGIELEAVHFTHPFNEGNREEGEKSPASRMADILGIPIRIIEWGDEFLEMIKHPRHGYGSAFNPCIDCRIYSFRQAGMLMKDIGADFIVTGEIQGQRPMSQRRFTINLIDRESGMKGLVLRPLCAKLMAPSKAEKEGLVEREKLKSFHGRNRQNQFRLAKQYGIQGFIPPGGGCLLTDKEFAIRLQDLLEHEPDCKMDAVRILKHGRHFRLPGGAKVVVGRNEKDNSFLEKIASSGDYVLFPVTVPGPTVICRNSRSEDDIRTAASLVTAYTKQKTPIDIEVSRYGETGTRILEKVKPLDQNLVRMWRICADNVEE